MDIEYWAREPFERELDKLSGLDPIPEPVYEAAVRAVATALLDRLEQTP